MKKITGSLVRKNKEIMQINKVEVKCKKKWRTAKGKNMEHGTKERVTINHSGKSYKMKGEEADHV